MHMCTFYTSSTTSNNQEVKRKIIKEIIDIPGIEYSEEEIKGKRICSTRCFCQ